MIIALLAALVMGMTSCSKDDIWLEGDINGTEKPVDPSKPDPKIESVTSEGCNFVEFGKITMSEDSVFTIPQHFATTLVVKWTDKKTTYVDTTYVINHSAKIFTAGKYVSNRSIFATAKQSGNTFNFGEKQFVANANLTSEVFLMTYKGHKVDVCNEPRTEFVYKTYKVEETGKTEGDWKELKVVLTFLDQYTCGSVDITAPAVNVFEPIDGTSPEIPDVEETIIGARELTSKHMIIEQNFDYSVYGQITSNEKLRLYYEVTSNIKKDTLFVERETQSRLYYKDATEQILKTLEFKLSADTWKNGTTYNGKTYLITLNGRIYEFETSLEKVSVMIADKFEVAFTFFGEFTNVDYKNTSTTPANPAEDEDFSYFNALHNMSFEHNLERKRSGEFSFRQDVKIEKEKVLEELLGLKKDNETLVSPFKSVVDATRIWKVKGDESFTFDVSRNVEVRAADKIVIYKNDKSLSYSGKENINRSWLSNVKNGNISGERSRYSQYFLFGEDQNGNRVKGQAICDLDDKLTYSEEGFSFALNLLEPKFEASLDQTPREGRNGIYKTYTYTVTYTATIGGLSRVVTQEIEVRVFDFDVDASKGTPLADKATVAWIVKYSRTKHLVINLVWQNCYENIEINQTTGKIVSTKRTEISDCSVTPTRFFAATFNQSGTELFPAHFITNDFNATNWSAWTQIGLGAGGYNTLIDEVSAPNYPKTPIVSKKGEGVEVIENQIFKITIPASLISAPDSGIERDNAGNLVYHF